MCNWGWHGNMSFSDLSISATPCRTHLVHSRLRLHQLSQTEMGLQKMSLYSSGEGLVAPAAFVPISKPGLPTMPSITKIRLMIRFWHPSNMAITCNNEVEDLGGTRKRRRKMLSCLIIAAASGEIFCLPTGPIPTPIPSIENSCYGCPSSRHLPRS